MAEAKQMMRIKIPKEGICCPSCKCTEHETIVPFQCYMPTYEVCSKCGEEFVIEGDEILFFK